MNGREEREKQRDWRDMIVKVAGVQRHLIFDLHDVDSNVY